MSKKECALSLQVITICRATFGLVVLGLSSFRRFFFLILPSYLCYVIVILGTHSSLFLCAACIAFVSFDFIFGIENICAHLCVVPRNRHLCVYQLLLYIPGLL